MRKMPSKFIQIKGHTMKKIWLLIGLAAIAIGAEAVNYGYAHLGSDGKVLPAELPAGGGTIGGSATAGQVSYGTSTDVITSSPNFLFDAAFSHLTLIGDGNDINLNSTGSTVGPCISLNHTGFGGNLFQICSTGAADAGGQGNLMFRNWSTGYYPIYITGSGNFGINNTNPLQKLDIVGNQYLNGFLQFRDDSTTNTEFAAVGYAQQVVGGTNGVAIQWMPASGLRVKYALSGSAGDRLAVLNDGTMLGVDGNVSAPSRSYLSDTNTGEYHSTTHVLDWAINGSRGMSLSASGLLVDPSATDANLLIGNQVRIGSGVSIASVNDALSANTPLELRATTLQLTAVGPGTVKLSTETPGPTLLDVLKVTSDANGGQVTIGNSSAAGIVSSTQRYIDFAQTITDFTPTNSWRLHSDRLIVDPAAASASDTATVSFSQVSIPSTNANDFGNLISNTAITSHAGGGAVNQNIARNTSATLTGAGSITTNAADSITCQATAASAGAITNNYCHVFNSGNQSAGSTIDTNFVTTYRTPRTDGPVNEHRAIYAEDQTGPTVSHFIYSEGGQSYHQGNFGIQNITPPAPLTIANNIYEGITYDGAGGWAGTGTAIELLHGAVRSSWQSTTGEAGTLAKFGTESNHGLLIYTNDTTAIAISADQTTDFSAAATFENDVSVNGRILGQLGVVTAANDIALPAHVGNSFSIGSSAVAVNTIDIAGWTPGSVIVLLCTSNFVFHHNTAGSGGMLELAGSVDYTCVPNGTLTLLEDGSNWQELARKAP